MIVHIINFANRSYYMDYLNEMFSLRKRHFDEQISWENSNKSYNIEFDDIDSFNESEYLLLLDDNGEILGFCRLCPVNKYSLINTSLKKYLDKDCAPSVHSWELSKFIITKFHNIKAKKQAMGHILCGIFEWAIIKNINNIVTVAGEDLFYNAMDIGLEYNILGSHCECKDGSIVAIEYSSNFNMLELVREYFNINYAVSYIAPPQIKGKVIKKSISKILSNIMETNSLENLSPPQNLFN